MRRYGSLINITPSAIEKRHLLAKARHFSKSKLRTHICSSISGGTIFSCFSSSLLLGNLKKKQERERGTAGDLEGMSNMNIYERETTFDLFSQL